jgi:hypothetical protein
MHAAIRGLIICLLMIKFHDKEQRASNSKKIEGSYFWIWVLIKTKNQNKYNSLS